MHLSGFYCIRLQLDSKRTHEVNVVGTENVIQTCIKLGVPRLVFASSVGVVFTDQEIINGDESMPYAPLDKVLCCTGIHSASRLGKISRYLTQKIGVSLLRQEKNIAY